MAGETGFKVQRPTKTLRELALDNLRDAITRGHFRPGDRLVERDLCNQLGVSRTIVREVLRHLESEGLVDNVANKGPAVALLDPEQARQIYEIRGALEGMAAKLCAESGDPTIATELQSALDDIHGAYQNGDIPKVLTCTTLFYETMFHRVGRDVAWNIVSSLTGRINHLRSMTIKTENRSVQGPAQMQRIIDAIGAGNGSAAYEAAVEHVDSASRIAEAVIRSERG